jgi:UDP-glucose 4-epimerase
MRIAIFGCRGFLGGTFARLAAARGHSLLGIARSAQPEADQAGEFLSADAAFSDLAPALRKFEPEAVLHAAGTASVPASLASPLDDLRGALLTFANTLDAVRRAELDCPVIFPSSAAVYGEPALLPVGEDAPLSPLSPYGFHKAACELVAREYAQVYGLRVTVARLFSLYGPRQRRLLLWELFTQAAGHGDTVVLAGTGDETRDYLHAEDACAALLALAAAPAERGSVNTVNVASGREQRTAELAQLVIDAVAPKKRLVIGGQRRESDPSRWRADIAKLAALGLPAPRPFDRGVTECLREWATSRGS